MGSTITVTKTLIRPDDFDDETNPVKRWDELMPDYVYSGGICPTSASLKSTITACVAYVEGHRVSVSATAKTFTASKDTYVDLDKDGAYQYSEVANNAAEPSIASDAIRMFKAITNGTGVTTVVDFRAINAGIGMGAPVGI